MDRRVARALRRACIGRCDRPGRVRCARCARAGAGVAAAQAIRGGRHARWAAVRLPGMRGRNTCSARCISAGGLGVPDDAQRATQLFERAAAQGDARAAFALSALGAHAAPPDLVAARSWLARAAALGHPEARRLLGVGELPLRPDVRQMAQDADGAWRWSLRRRKVPTSRCLGPCGPCCRRERRTRSLGRRCIMRRRPDPQPRCSGCSSTGYRWTSATRRASPH